MRTVEEIEAAIAPARLLSGGDQDQHAGLIHEQTAIAGLVPFRTHLPKPTQERTNLPQVLQALHVLITDLAPRSLSHDGRDTATLTRAQLCQDCSSCRVADSHRPCRTGLRKGHSHPGFLGMVYVNKPGAEATG